MNNRKQGIPAFFVYYTNGVHLDLYMYTFVHRITTYNVVVVFLKEYSYLKLFDVRIIAYFRVKAIL
jgi:hypothetical protein